MCLALSGYGCGEKSTNQDKGHKGPRAVFMGNSITQRWQRDYSPDFFTQNNYVCKGIGGQKAWQMVERFYMDVIVTDPHCVVILAGTNDVIANNDSSVNNRKAFDKIVEMAEDASRKSIKVVLCSIPPAYKSGLNWHGAIIEMNGWISQYALENGMEYVDYHTALKDENNRLAYEYEDSTHDGIHPGATAYPVMEALVKAAIDRALSK